MAVAAAPSLFSLQCEMLNGLVLLVADVNLKRKLLLVSPGYIRSGKYIALEI